MLHSFSARSNILMENVFWFRAKKHGRLRAPLPALSFARLFSAHSSSALLLRPFSLRCLAGLLAVFSHVFFPSFSFLIRKSSSTESKVPADKECLHLCVVARQPIYMIVFFLSRCRELERDRACGAPGSNTKPRTWTLKQAMSGLVYFVLIFLSKLNLTEKLSLWIKRKQGKVSTKNMPVSWVLVSTSFVTQVYCLQPICFPVHSRWVL